MPQKLLIHIKILFLIVFYYYIYIIFIKIAIIVNLEPKSGNDLAQNYKIKIKL